jgi:hypothetical protein
LKGVIDLTPSQANGTTDAEQPAVKPSEDTELNDLPTEPSTPTSLPQANLITVDDIEPKTVASHSTPSGAPNPKPTPEPNPEPEDEDEPDTEDEADVTGSPRTRKNNKKRRNKDKGIRKKNVALMQEVETLKAEFEMLKQRFGVEADTDVGPDTQEDSV